MNQKPNGSAQAPPRSFNEHDIISEYFQEHPRPGVMIDVGAMDGSSSRAFAKLGWDIYAFEPDPQKDLRSDPDFSDPAKVRIFEVALSDRPGREAPFFASPESRGVSTLRPFLESHQEIGRVEVKTLSEVVRNESIKRIDYLKIDTEGFDFKVLQGFPWRRGGLERLGRSRWPEVILCEFDDSKSRQQGYDYATMGNALEQRGYEVYLSEWSPIQEYGQPHNWVAVRRFPCEPPAEKAWGNFLAISPCGHGETLRRLILEAVLSDRAKVQESLSNREHNLPTLRAALEKREQVILSRNATLVQKNEALERRKDALERLRDALTERNAEMEKRLADIQALKEAVRKREEAILERNDALVHKNEALVRQKETLERLRDALSERNAGMEKRLADIQALKEAVRKKDETIAHLKMALAQKDKGLERLQEALLERNAGMEKRLSDIQALREAVRKRDDTIAGLKAALPQKDEGLARLRDALAERTTNLENLRSTVAQRDSALTELKEQLLARETAIQKLRAALGTSPGTPSKGPP